ncbi:tcyA [Symbiodinium microadriaticum]|nr:tcyA [Symbiodinium microadriaticum]
MKPTCFALLAAALTVLCHASAAATQNPGADAIVLAVHYPPYEMSEPVDGLHGFDHEVVIEAFRRTGVEAQVVYVPWTRAVSDTTNGLSPALLSCAKNAERTKVYLFSDPISQDTYGLYYRKDFRPPDIQKLEDVIGQSVASVSGYASLAKLVRSEAAGFQMLALGRFDFLYSGKQATDFQIMQHGMTGLFGFVETESWQYHLCFSKKHPRTPELRPLFNKGLAEIRADGTYQKIHIGIERRNVEENEGCGHEGGHRQGGKAVGQQRPTGEENSVAEIVDMHRPGKQAAGITVTAMGRIPFPPFALQLRPAVEK